MKRPGFVQILKSRFILGLVLSLPIGVLASYLANEITQSEPRLIVDIQSSTVAASTVTDVTIVNDGEFDLAGLRGAIPFSSPVEYSIRPAQFASCAAMQDSTFQLRCPATLALEPSYSVDIRFTSRGEHSVRDRKEVIGNISAAVVYPQIKAVPLQPGALDQFFASQTIVGALIVLVLVLVGALVWLLRRSAKARAYSAAVTQTTFSAAEEGGSLEQGSL